MSVIDEALTANQRHAQNFKLGKLAMPPARKLAIVACMDARLTIEQVLGLKTGEAHIIRNAGGIVTEVPAGLIKSLRGRDVRRSTRLDQDRNVPSICDGIRKDGRRLAPRTLS